MSMPSLVSLFCVSSLRKHHNRVSRLAAQTFFKAQSFGNAQLLFGAFGLTLLLSNRLTLESISDTQARLDIVALLACASIALDALSTQGILQKERDAVPAIGTRIEKTVSPAQSWLLNELLRCVKSSATSCIMDKEQGIIAIVGVTRPHVGNIGSGPAGKIAQDVISKHTELYLPDLQVLPGKVEFNYLPVNCQAAYLAALPEQQALVIGYDRAKSVDVRTLQTIRSLVKIYLLLQCNNSS